MPGEVVGLVGESGCGKSTLGRIMAGIMPQSEGEVLWQGQDRRRLAPARTPGGAALRAQMIFQDPMSSLNPRKRVDRHHRRGAGRPRPRAAAREGCLCGGADGAGRARSRPIASRYPHQFSGGQRQRIGIARALAVKPQFIVCDESVAALDVSIQAQIINLFMDLKRELGLTYLFISHDLGVVKHISDRVAIMYLGRIVESAPADEFFARPNHPYTRRAARRGAHASPIGAARLLADQGRDPVAAQAPERLPFPSRAARTPSTGAARRRRSCARSRRAISAPATSTTIKRLSPTADNRRCILTQKENAMKHASHLKTPWPRRIGWPGFSPCRRPVAADLIIGSSTEPSALDPHFSRTGNNQNIAAQIFDRLMSRIRTYR